MDKNKKVVCVISGIKYFIDSVITTYSLTGNVMCEFARIAQCDNAANQRTVNIEETNIRVI